MTNTTLYLPFYYEWADNLESLADEDVGRLLRAIVDLARNGEDSNKVSELSPMAKMAYKFIASSIDRSEKKRLAGQKGGLARAKTADSRENCENEINEGAIPTNSEKTEENTENVDKKCEKSTKSTTPSLSEVREFFKNRGFTSNPDEFFNFYESNGWLVGQNPMVNWHSSAENWEIRDKRSTERNKNGDNAQVSPHLGENRSYDVHEAFRLALERSYGPNADLDED